VVIGGLLLVEFQWSSHKSGTRIPLMEGRDARRIKRKGNGLVKVAVRITQS
jgi:hypothetical protein